MRGSIAAEAASSEPAALELYAYTSTYAVAPEDIADVLAHITQVAVKHNARVGITGVLSDMTHAYLGNFRAVATEYFACVARVVRAAGGGVTNVAGAR